MKILTWVLSLMLGLAGLVSTTPVFAQAAQPPSSERPAASYSDSELKSFAVAVLAVNRINDAYVQKRASAKSPEEQQQLQQSASQEMIRMLEKEGMSVDKYREIMSHSETNPAVAERVREHIRTSDK